MNIRQRLLRILLVALLGLAVQAAARHVTTSPGAAPRAAGMLAAIDPETGQLTAPSPEQSRALQGGLEVPRKSGHVTITTRPDGAEIGTLDTSYLNYSVAHIDANGRLHTDCTGTAPVAPTDAPAPEQ